MSPVFIKGKCMLSGDFIFNSMCSKCGSSNLKDDFKPIDIENITKYKKCCNCGNLNTPIDLVERPEFVQYLKETLKPMLENFGFEITYFEPDVKFENRSTFFNRLIAYNHITKLHLCLTCGMEKDNIEGDVLLSDNWTWQFAFCPKESFDRWANSRHIVKYFYNTPSYGHLLDVLSTVQKIKTEFKIPDEISYIKI